MASGNDLIKKELNELGQFLKKELQKELLFQKHKATGGLLDSIEMTVEQTLGKIILTETHLFYGDFVDRGRRPGFPASGNGSFLLALERWVRIKGFAPGREKGVAFAIRRKIFEQGIPTSGGKRIAPRRLNWLTGTIKRNETKINETIESATFQQLDVLINNILAQTNERIRATQG